MNFLEEAENIRHFYDCNETVDYMHCLTCYEDYTTEKVLVMEYIEGIIHDLDNNLTIMSAVGLYMKRYLSKNFDLIDELKKYGGSFYYK